MANRLNRKIIYIDQFDADVTLAAVGLDFCVKKIILRSVASGDVFQFEDVDGNVMLPLTQTASNGTVESYFGDKGYNFGGKGVIVDVSDCTGLANTDGTDAVWIYLI